MKKISKVISIILAVMMVISTLPITASAATVSGKCGANLTWTYDDATGTLTISGTGAMYDYDYNNRPWESYQNSIKKVVINDGVTTIGNYAFESCDLTSVTIPDSVTTIGNYAFCACYNLTSVTIPDSVTTISDYAFYACSGLTRFKVDSKNKYYSNDEDGVLLNKNKTILIQYPAGNTRTGYTTPHSVSIIGENAFFCCNNLTSIVIGDSVTTISRRAFYACLSLASVTISDSVTIIDGYAFNYCDNLIDVYYTGTVEEWNKISIDNVESGNDSLLHATIHCNNHVCNYTAIITEPTCTEIGYTTYTCSVCGDSYVANYVNEKGHTIINNVCSVCGYSFFSDDIYNLGEETYSFKNFGDSDSKGGHCFGMSITSAGYYNNILDITDVGGNVAEDVYGLSINQKVKKPICDYQQKQGPYSVCAMVAGGSAYLGKTADIQSDWYEVVKYVCSHEYDNKGTIQIGFIKKDQGGHAINFLRYEVVNGQERIYAYDNNFPNVETYFYKDSNGNVYQAPYSTFNGPIDSITLRNVNTYYANVGNYDATRYLYGDAKQISIPGSVAYPMECGIASYTMFEIPSDVEQVVIIPLVDNATFEYCDKEYSFGEISDNTIGVFALATSEENVSGEANLIIEELKIEILQPSMTTIRHKDGIKLHTKIEGTVPDGCYVKWVVSNDKFKTEEISNGDSLQIISDKNGDTTFTAILCDKDGNELARDTIEMKSKAGFFDKIGSFFRGLFRLTRIHEN